MAELIEDPKKIKEVATLSAKDEAVGAVNRIRIVGGPADMKPCHAVIEVIVENLEAKQTLYRDLEAIVGADCIFGTNTSSLSVDKIGEKLKNPERLVGFHFFNPVAVMPP